VTCLNERPTYGRKEIRMTTINRLTVDGRDYFLPDPVTELREKILEAIRQGGGYVNIPPLRSGPGIDILFSPGMPVVWTRIDVGTDSDEPAGPLDYPDI
jgi:hypothetical protein